MTASTINPANAPATAAASPGDALAIDVRGLSHTYKPKRARKPSKRRPVQVDDAALDRVDLQVRPGEIFALLGPNGSGKSTLLRILATVQAARQNASDSSDAPGFAKLFGHDIAEHPQHARQALGVVFQHPAIDLKLTAIENLRLHGKLYGLSGDSLEQAARQALVDLGLEDRQNDFTESFSGGMRRRVEIAKALLTRPRLLLMDEASAGLDIAIQREIWSDLRRLVKDTGLTVLLTTHLMDEAELADRVAVMSAGKLVAVDTPDALVATVGGQVLQITPANQVDAEDLLQRVREAVTDRLAGCELRAYDGKVHLEHPDAASIIETLTEQLGDDATTFRLGRPNLADAYLKLTGQSLGSATV